MQLIRNIGEMQALSTDWRRRGERIAFVPTMGNLHDGHLALVAKAMDTAQRVVVSIFVNPLQFDEARDFEAYPRTLDADLARLADYRVDAVFVPSESTLYPRGREAITRIEVPQLSDILEGACRPGHFSGVATVVAKLFHCVQPQQAVFGEKDYQQLLIVRRMVADLNLPVEILALPTVREADGLALSSRNRRLTPAQRARAPRLYQVMQALRSRILDGEQDYDALAERAAAELEAAGLATEYVTVRDAEQLGRPLADRPRIILAAARLGQTRLIDNLWVEKAI